MNGSYLVNIVANDFKDGLTIFEPFQLDQVTSTLAGAASGTAETVVNGVKGAVESITEGVKKVMNGDSPLAVNGHANGNGNRVATNGH